MQCKNAPLTDISRFSKSGHPTAQIANVKSWLKSIHVCESYCKNKCHLFIANSVQQNLTTRQIQTEKFHTSEKMSNTISPIKRLVTLQLETDFFVIFFHYYKKVRKYDDNSLTLSLLLY